MKSLTVVQLLPALNGGGVEKGTLEVAHALVKAGHRSIVISAGGGLVPLLVESGSEHIQWDLGKKSPFTFLQVGKLRHWLTTHAIDILHVRSRMPAWVAWLAWRKMPVATRPYFITTMHGLNSVSRYSKIMTYGEKVIAVSDTVKKYLLDHYSDVPENKITVIHRGIDSKEFPFGYQPQLAWKQQWKNEFPQTNGKWLLTLPGRLTRLKGHYDFVAIIQQLQQHIPNVHGLIVGGEDPKRQQYASDLYKKVNKLGLSHVISFTGYRQDMKDIYAISDAILSLSTKPESFGRTSVEALSLGKAVIAYNHGGVGETLGVLYPQGLAPLKDLDEIVNRCIGLYTKQIIPPTQQQMVYLKETMLQQTLALYQQKQDGG